MSSCPDNIGEHERSWSSTRLQKAITEVDRISTPLIDTDGLDDGHFSMNVLDTSARTVSKYGHCVICSFNPDSTFTDRMLGYTHESTLRKHLVAIS